MIWADRVGLGIVAILGMLVAYLTIDNRSQIRAVQANYAHSKPITLMKSLSAKNRLALGLHGRHQLQMISSVNGLTTILRAIS